MKNKKVISWLLIILGLLVIIGTNTFMLIFPMSPGLMQIAHAVVNLISAISIFIGVVIKSIK